MWEKAQPDADKRPKAGTDQKESPEQEMKSNSSAPQSTARQTTDTPVKPDPGDARKKATGGSRLPAPDRVKLEALEKAKELGTIVRIKVCHVAEDDEWWAFLYKDEGSIIDLKQFVWNRKTEKLEPFLVIRQIKKDQLDSELRKKEAGRKCMLVDIAK